MMRTRMLVVLAGFVAVSASAQASAQPAPPATSPAAVAADAPGDQLPVTPVPRFKDPDRRAKLISVVPKIDDLVRQRREQLNLPGVFYGIIVDGELVASRAFGVREVDSQAPFTPATVSRIASMTKSFTALAILKLRDAGKLALDDPLSKYVPEAAGWRYPTRDAAPITLRQLLMHMAGFPEDNPWGDRQLAISDETMTAWLKAGLPFSTSPGTAYEYSNYGFALLGRIVSVASGMRYQDHVTREILEPLGMRSTFFDVQDAPRDRVAQGYRWQDGRWQDEPPLSHGAFGAMGGLYTSGEDLARYVAFHMAAWPPRDDPESGPVRRSSVREMQVGWDFAGFTVDRPVPDAPLDASTRAYGFGLSAIRDCRAGFSVSHGGGLPGFGSHMLWLPEYGVGVIALANLTYAPASLITRDVIGALLATGALEPRVLPASRDIANTTQTIFRNLNEWDDAAMAAIAADNLFLDRSAGRRRADLDAIRAQVGACTATEAVVPENWLRARFRARCEHGWIDVSFTLAPTMPPRVQFLSFEPGSPLSGSMREMTSRFEAALHGGPGAPVKELFGGAADASRIESMLADLRMHYGACHLGDTQSGDGQTRARVRFECDRGRFDAWLQRDAAEEEFTGVRVTRVPGDPCVP